MTTTRHDGPAIEHVIGDRGELTIRLASAEVRLAGTTGDRVIVRTPSGRSLPDRLIVEANDGDFTIREKDAIGLSFQIGGGGRLVQLEVEVPAKALVHTDVTSGWIDAIGLTGEQRYRATSAEVRLREVSGAIELNTVSGDATLELAAAADLRIRSVSGDIRVSGGRLDSLRINTTSGDVRLDTPLVGVDDNVIDTLSGDVLVTVDGGIKVDAKTVSGDLMTDLPHRSDGRMGRRTLVVGDGQIPLAFRSVSGDLRIQDAASVVRSLTAPKAPTAPTAPKAPTAPMPPVAPARPAMPNAAASQEGVRVMDDTTPADPTAADDPIDARRMTILRALEQGELDVATAMDQLAALDEASAGNGEDGDA